MEQTSATAARRPSALFELLWASLEVDKWIGLNGVYIRAANADMLVAALPEEQLGPLLRSRAADATAPRPLQTAHQCRCCWSTFAEFLGGVVRKEELRNAREFEFAEALVALRT